MNTMSRPGAIGDDRTISRSRLLTLLRTTALPTRFPTTKPYLFLPRSLGTALRTISSQAQARPRLRTLANSKSFRSLSPLPSTTTNVSYIASR
jgi:hypothetical protein